MADFMKPWAENPLLPANVPARALEDVDPLLDKISDVYLVRFLRWIMHADRAGWEVRAIVNPTTFKESVQAHYSARPVLGFSQEVQQYVRTGSRKISMELWLSYHILVQRMGIQYSADYLLTFKNFFMSLLVPQGPRMAPPLVRIIWPGAELNFTGVLESLNVEYERFNWQGVPIEMKLDTSFIEINNIQSLDSASVGKYGMGGIGALASRAVQRGLDPAKIVDLVKNKPR